MTTESEKKKLLTIAEACSDEWLGVDEGTLRKAFKESAIPHIHLGSRKRGVIKIPTNQLELFIEGKWMKDVAGVLFGDAPPICKRCKGEEVEGFQWNPSIASLNS